MIDRLLAGALLLLMSIMGQTALAQRTPPASVTLTPEQWTCVQARLPKMLEGEGPDYRVPLAPCTPAELRGPGASNATVAGVPDSRAVDPGAARVSAPKPIPDNVTRAPLYLRKQDIACIETQLPKLTPSTQATMTIDLKACAVLP